MCTAYALRVRCMCTKCVRCMHTACAPRVHCTHIACATHIGELQLLDMSAVDGRPENLLIDRLLVPPVAIRPSVDAGPQGSNEDDLTVKLSEILTVNSIIRNALQGGKVRAT